MIDLEKIENFTKIGNLITTRAKQFENEQDWENYLNQQGITTEFFNWTFSSLDNIEKTPETFLIWDYGWNWRRGSSLKYLVIPRKFAETALIFMILP